MSDYTLSCLDSRYAKIVVPITEIFCEHSLISKKVKCEIYWLLYLSEIFDELLQFKELIQTFKLENINIDRIKKIDSVTKHDIKAIEYYVKEKLEKYVDENWNILTEAIQTLLRKWNYPNPYETLKDLSRGKVLTKKLLLEFIETLNLPPERKEILTDLTPTKFYPVVF